MHEAPVKQLGTDLIEDQEFTRSKLVALATWNIQGKSVLEAYVVLEDCLHDFNVVSFQEVSGCSQLLSKGSYCFGGEVGPGVSCIYAWPEDCFRPLAVAFDSCIGWSGVFVRHSHMSLSLQVPGLSRPIVWVCAHLPHISRPLEDLTNAIESLQQDVQPWLGKHLSIVLAGDLNYPLADDVSQRSQMVQQMCSLLDLNVHSCSTTPTRSSGLRRFDHIVINPIFQQQCLSQEVQESSCLECAFEGYHWDVPSCTWM